MSSKTYPVFGGGPVGSGQLNFPLIAPTPGAAGSEPFRFQTGGGIHGNSSGGVALSVANGDAVVVDAQANVSLPQTLAVTGLATLTGGISSPQASLGQLTVTGDSSLNGNLGIGGSAQITGDLTAHKITASSDLSAASLSTSGHIAGGSLTITGQTTLAGLNVQGTFHAEDIQSDGNFYFPASSPNAPGIALADEHGTGLFAAQGSLGLSVAGQAALSFGSDLKANFAGTVAGGSGQFTDLTTATLKASGQSTLHAVAATTLALSDAATFASNLDVQGNLQVEGTTRLANLAIDMLSTDHDLTVGGNATIKGTTTLQGALTSTSSASFSSISTGSFATSLIVLDKIRQRGTDNTKPYVDNDVTPGGTVIPYTALLAAQGVLKIAGAFTSLAGGSFGSDVSINGNLSAGQGTFSAGVSAQGNGSFGGTGSFGGALSAAALSATGLVTAASSKIGGSTFQTCQGTPNGQTTGSVGDWVIDSQSGLAYLKFSGSATNTGWVEVTTQANATGFPLLAPDGQPSAVPFGFSADGGAGMGHNSSLGLYLSVAGAAALTIAGSGAAAFTGALTASQALSVQGALTVQGASSLQALTAGTTQLGGLTAGNTTLDTLSAQATTVGSLGAGASTLASLSVQGASSLQGALSVGGAITSQLSVAAPKALVGGSALTAGTGSPNGAVSGSPGDGFFEQDTGTWWIKTSGQATQTGWSSIATSSTATAFPLSAPLAANLSTPSYGFASSQMGLTDQGANVLVGVTSGAIGWKLDASQNFSLTANLAVAGTASITGALSAASTLSVAGQSILAGLSAGAISGSSTLSVTGASSLAAVSAAAVTATSLTTTTGSVTSAQNVTAASTLSGLLVVSNGTTWRAANSAPSSSVGQAGDLASIQGTSDHPLQVRVGSTWKQVSFVGDATPSQFPLTGPADSASAPNYSTSLSPNTGMYFPAANQIAWSTNGVRAGMVDANQNWSFVGTVAGGAATFSGLTVNGTASITGNTSVGGTFQATGQATFANSITAQSAAISQGITASQATINGALSAQTATTSGDVAIGGNLTVSGATTYNGVNRAGYYQVGDGTISAPAYAFTNETGLGIWRKGAGNLAFAAAGSNLLSLTASSAAFSGGGSFPGTVSAAVIDAPTVRNSGGTLSLQAGTTTVLSVGASSIGAAQPLYVPAGSANAPGLVVGAGGGLSSANDTRPTYPVSVSLTNPRGAGIQLTTVPDYNTNSNYYIFGIAGGGITVGPYPPNGYANGAPGYLYQYTGGGSGSSLYVFEGTQSGNGSWVAVRTASQPVTPTYPAVGPAGSAAAPTFAVGSASTGLYAGTDANSRAFVGLAQGGAAVARLATFQNNSTQVYVLGLGDPASSSVSGGLVASAQAPSTGAPAAFPGMLYQDTRGGAAQSLWINESTTSTPAFAKVLTTSSPSPQPTFPLLGPADSVAAPDYSWAGSSGSGMYLAAANSVGFATQGTRAATISSAQAWTFFGAVTASTTLAVTGTVSLSATLGVAGAATLSSTLNVAGATTLQSALGGTSASFSGNVQVGGTLSVTGATSGSTSSWSTSTTSPIVALTEGAAPSTGSAGQLFVKSADHNLYFVSSTGTTTQLTPPSSTFPLLGPADSVTAPDYSWSGNAGTGMYLAGTNSIGFTTAGVKAATVSSAQAWNFAGAVTAATTLAVTGATTLASTLQVGGATTLQAALSGTSGAFSGNATVGGTLGVTGLTTASGGVLAASGNANAPGLAVGAANSGFWAGADGYSTPAIGVTVAGLANSVFKTTSANSTPVYIFGLGVAASTTANGGIIASAQTPVGQIGAFPSQLYQWLGGGPSKSLWVYEGTSSGNSSWAQVLTTSSTVSPTFPLQSTTLGTATAPAYGFSVSGYTGTGFLAVNDVGGGNLPAAAVTSGGVICGYFTSSTQNSTALYTLSFGNPTTNASPYNGVIRSSAQTFSGNVAGAPGQLAINPAGASGTMLAVKESGTGTSGWSFVYTQGTAQIAGQAGTVAAPYHSFSNSTNSGFSYNSTNGALLTSVAGTTVLTQGTVGTVFGNSGYVQVPAGAYNQPSLCFTGNTTTGLYSATAFSNPSVVFSLAATSTMGLVKYSGTNSGVGWALGPNCVFDTGGIIWSPNMPNGTATASPGTIFVSTAGGAGTTAWVKESGSQTTSGYAALLTTTSSQSALRLVQGAASAAVSGQTILTADTAAGRVNYVTSASSAASVQPYLQPDIAATPYNATQTITAAQCGITVISSSATQYTLTLPASVAYDLVYRFQVENAAGVVIKANASQVIQYGTSASSTAGTLTSTAVGSTVELFLRAGTNTWYARGPAGTWTTA